MRTLFTIHAGEYLVGSEIEERFPTARVWLPSKDTGIDLLVTNSSNTRAVALQVKYSRDFIPLSELVPVQLDGANGTDARQGMILVADTAIAVAEVSIDTPAAGDMVAVVRAGERGSLRD